KLVVAHPGPEGARGPSHDRRANLMGHKDPAIDFTDVLPAKGVGGDSQRWRHRGEPVEAVNYSEHKQTLEVLNKRQDEKRQTAQRIDNTHTLARLTPVARPTRQQRSDQIQPAHYAAQRPRITL